MTVTTYICHLQGPDRRFYGFLFWDKHTPRTLIGKLCPFVSQHEIGYSVWTSYAPYGRDGQRVLIRRLKAKARRMALTVETEETTDYARFLGPMS